MNLKIPPIKTEYYPDVITTFQPVFIKNLKYPKKIFQKRFSHVPDDKKGILYRYANIKESASSFLFSDLNLDILNFFSPKKLRNMYSLVKMKDFSRINRFSPEELFVFLKLKNEDINFLKPFARQKKYNGMFNYSVHELFAINKHSSEEKLRFMDLLQTHLDYKTMDTIVKDKAIDTADFSSAVRDIQQKHAENIAFISAFKNQEGYKIRITTKEPFTTTTYPYNSGNSAIKMTEKRFLSLGKIKEEIDKITELNNLVNKHNYEIINKRIGKSKNYSFSLSPNLIKNEWEKGNLVKEDIQDLFTEAAGIVSNEVFKYFASHEFKLTPFDNDKTIKARKYNVIHKELDLNSDYYKEKEVEIINREFQKLEKADSDKKLLIVDGLPGAGKTTAYRSFIKNSNEAYYITDVDDLRMDFPELYNGGTGSVLVHKAVSNIYKNKIIPEALSKGKNVVYQMCGSYEKLNAILRKAHKNGYTINYININTNSSASIINSNNRQKTNGRFMDPYIILSLAKVNAGAKQYMAKIISYSPLIDNSYNYKYGVLSRIENGNEVEDIKLNTKSEYYFNKIINFFKNLF